MSFSPLITSFIIIILSYLIILLGSVFFLYPHTILPSAPTLLSPDTSLLPSVTSHLLWFSFIVSIIHSSLKSFFPLFHLTLYYHFLPLTTSLLCHTSIFVTSLSLFSCWHHHSFIFHIPLSHIYIIWPALSSFPVICHILNTCLSHSILSFCNTSSHLTCHTPLFLCVISLVGYTPVCPVSYFIKSHTHLTYLWIVTSPSPSFAPPWFILSFCHIPCIAPYYNLSPW